MTTFNDKQKRAWTLELTVGSARRVKADTTVDLVNIISLENDGKASMEALGKLVEDPFALVDVIFSLCKPQAEKEGITDKQFADLLDADAVEAAANALVEEIINFCPAAKRKALKKINQIAQRIAAKNEAELDEMLESGQLERELEKQLNASYTNTRESSVSTPTPSPSAS